MSPHILVQNVPHFLPLEDCTTPHLAPENGHAKVMELMLTTAADPKSWYRVMNPAETYRTVFSVTRARA